VARLGPSVLFADPDYDLPPAGKAKPSAAKHDEEDEKLVFTRLKGFAAEARAVTQAWQAARGGEPLQLHQDKKAEKAALRSVTRPQLLYFITHGFFLDEASNRFDKDSRSVVVAQGSKLRLPDYREDPRLRSGLARAGANHARERAARGQSDGLLTALEVQDLNLLGTELVVLSACQTGLGTVQVGEGVIGLRRAFQQAGARTVVASLWKVPDRETAELMGRFMKSWLGGRPPAESLRQAQLELIAQLRAESDAQRRQAPPLWWAGVICHGALR